MCGTITVAIVIIIIEESLFRSCRLKRNTNYNFFLSSLELQSDPAPHPASDDCTGTSAARA